jgi:protease II
VTYIARFPILACHAAPLTKPFSTIREYRTSEFVETEIRKFQHTLQPLNEHVLQIRESIMNDYLTVSGELESSGVNQMHDVSGPYEYYSLRKHNENYCNIYRKKTNSGKEESVLNLDKLSSTYNQMLTMVEFKLSQCHTLAAVIVELHDSDRYAVIVKDVTKNVTCEITLPPEISPLSMEVVSARSDVYLVIASSVDGVRPSRVFTIRLNRNNLFGLRGWSATQRMRTITIDKESVSCIVDDLRPAFFLSLGRSKDDRYLFIHHHSKTSSEITLLDVLNPHAPPITLKSAKPGEQMFVDHIPGYFYVAERTTSDSELEIKRLSSAGCHITRGCFDELSEWEHIWPSESDRAKGYFVEDYDIFEHYLVVYGRSSINGNLFVQLLGLRDGEVVKEHTCESLFPMLGTRATTLTPRANLNYLSQTARFVVCSPILPGVN